MKLSTLKLVALALVCAPFAVACSADTSDAIEGDGDDVSVDEANAARIAPGEFKLYTEARTAPNPNCDLHTKLVLSATSGSKAHLEEGLEGFCEIAVVPNPRDYRLRAAGQDCGSRIFTGSFKKDGEKHSIKIIDNRTRLCENVVAGAIEVEETTPRGTVQKYSYDAPPAPALVCPSPGYVNCMPGPNRRLSNLCSSENRAWAEANCPGVKFTF
jgi:hypothetical protein